MPTTPYPFVSGEVLLASDLNAIQNLPLNDKTDSYTLEVADAYKRVVMNKATATTLTVNDSIFTAGDVIQVLNKGAGTMTITAGAGVTINTAGSLAVAQYGGGTLVALSASVFNFFSPSGSSYGVATGGSSTSITVGGVNYTLLDFTSDGTLTVTKSGLFDVLLLSGGGGGGGGINTGGFGGGGAGSFTEATIYLTANATVDVGAGGTGSTGGNLASPQNGFSSSIGAQANGIIGVGGGSGAHYSSGQDIKANVGGSGGGGGGAVSTTGASPASTGFGYSGGNGGVGGSLAGGGGGGSSANGSNNSGATGGAGGAGTSLSTFTGGTITTTVGLGGAGGSVVGGAGTSGGANTGTGGGGGGGTGTTAGGAGGSGRVFVRFKV